jgi:hypothetical protein
MDRLLEMSDPATAVAIVVVLLAVLLVPFLAWEMRRGKARGRWWFNRAKPRGHGDIGPDLGDRSTSNPYSGEAQARR